MQTWITPVAIVFVSSAPLVATDSLYFNGGGYCIEVIVGFDGKPIISQILFTPPGAESWVELEKNHLFVDAFDVERRVLKLRYKNPMASRKLPSFSLNIQDGFDYLFIGRRRIRGKFDWVM